MLKLFLIFIHYRGEDKCFKTADFVVAEKNRIVAIEEVGVAVWRTHHTINWDVKEHCSINVKEIGEASDSIKRGILLERYQKD